VLSGGERRLLEISRALVMGPDFLLFDVPSIGLEPRFIDMVFNILDELQHTDGKTIIIVEQYAKKGLVFADIGMCLSQAKPLSPRLLTIFSSTLSRRAFTRRQGFPNLFTHHRCAVHIAVADILIIVDGVMHGAAIVPHYQIPFRPTVAIEEFGLCHVIE